jgi:hypothetical protein
MSNIQRIFIEMDNLSDSQQLDLWQALWDFADKKLEHNKNLMVFTISKTTQEQEIAQEIFDALRYYNVPLGNTKNKKKWGTGDFFNAINRLFKKQ